MPFPRIIRLLVVCVLALPLLAQSATVTTLAGSTKGGGYTDGTGADARFSRPDAVAAGAAGILYVADTGNHTIRRITPDSKVTTFAGSHGHAGQVDGAALAARFRFPAGIAVRQSDGSIYVSDTGNHVIRRITAQGQVVTIAGLAGSFGSADGSGSAARFNEPRGLAVDSSGNVYVADYMNEAIRKITPQGVVTTLARTNGPYDVAIDPATGQLYVTGDTHSVQKLTLAGQLTTFAGPEPSGQDDAGFADGTGTAARFYWPSGLDVDPSGNIYVTDYRNMRIRKVTPAAVVTTIAGPRGIARAVGIAIADGQLFITDHGKHAILKLLTTGGDVTLFAGSVTEWGHSDGTGTLARFFLPRDVAVDRVGNVYVSEPTWIRKITPQGLVTTFAGMPHERGTQDGTGTAARFVSAAGITVDATGNVFVADDESHTIRKITPEGVVTTFAGIPNLRGYADGAATQARFRRPNDVVFDSRGYLFVTDTGNALVRMIDPSGVVTTFAGTLANELTGPSRDSVFWSPSSIACDREDNLYVTDPQAHSIMKITPQRVVTTVAGVRREPGSVDGEASVARFSWPKGVTVDADRNIYVTSGDTLRRISPDGIVTTVAGLAGSPGNVNGAGTAARFDVPRGLAVLPTGQIVIAAAYDSAIRIATMRAATTLAISASPSPAVSGKLVTITATLAVAKPPDSAPAAAIRFKSGSTLLGTATLAKVGTGEYRAVYTKSFPVGSHSISAEFAGDAVHEAAVSIAHVLAVCAAPAITQQPTAVSIDPGQPASLSVAVTSAESLSYQWFRGAAGNTTDPVSGAALATLTISPAATTSYWVRVTNNCAAVNSTAANVTVRPAAAIPAPDFDRNLHDDILWREPSTGRNVLWLMNGTTRTAYVNLATLSGTAWNIVATGDFNGDGDADIVWRNTSTGANMVWLMAGTTRTATVNLASVATTWQLAGSGDFNADGRSDLVWREPSTGNNAIWLMNGTTRAASVAIARVTAPEWEIAGSGDFNDDGRSDILWRNSTTAVNVVWFMSGTIRTATANVAAVADTAWRIGAIGDYNNDRKSDLIWRNATTGENMIWLMNGTTRSSSVALPSVPTTFVMVGPR